jgi:hypothetical protein
MANPEQSPTPEKDAVQFDSLNSDVFEPTDVVVDNNTVRPMRDSMRKWLKLPPYDKPATGQAPQEPGPDKPSV